jgi:hypothetical protein
MYNERMNGLRIALLLTLLLGQAGFFYPAQAEGIWHQLFHRDENCPTEKPPVASPQPEADYGRPTPEAFEQCEALRRRIVDLNQKNFFFHPLYRPQIGYLKRKHYRCVANFETQERLFLKTAEVDPTTAKVIGEPGCEKLPPLKATPSP